MLSDKPSSAHKKNKQQTQREMTLEQLHNKRQDTEINDIETAT